MFDKVAIHQKLSSMCSGPPPHWSPVAWFAWLATKISKIIFNGNRQFLHHRMSNRGDKLAWKNCQYVNIPVYQSLISVPCSGFYECIQDLAFSAYCCLGHNGILSPLHLSHIPSISCYCRSLSRQHMCTVYRSTLTVDLSFCI
jgi:hypothetical protein